MKRITLLLALFAALPAFAQANTACTCVATGCVLVGQVYAPTDPLMPTDCQLQNAAGVQVASGPPQLTTGWPADNSSVCFPGTVTPQGVAGSKACFLPTGPLAAGTYTFTASAAINTNQGPKGPPLTFDSVAVLPKFPIAVILHIGR